MDNGQFLIDPVTWLENEYMPVFQTSKPSLYRRIGREVEYDPNSLLQIIESTTTHIPQGDVIPLDSLQITIDTKFISYPQFMIQNRLTENVIAQPTVFTNENILFDNVYIDITRQNLSIWARQRMFQELIRENDFFEPYNKVLYDMPYAASFREQEWYLCAETMRNFNPLKYKNLDTILKTSTIIRSVPIDQIIAAVLSDVANASGISLYHEFVLPYELILQKPNPRTIQKKIYEMCARVYQFVKEPRNKQFLLSDKTNCMILWLTLPHIGGSQIVCAELDFVVFALSVVLIAGRFPTDEEWIGRQNANERPGEWDPTYKDPPTTITFVEPV